MKKVLYVLLALVVIIQFFHPKKNISTKAEANYIGNKYAVSEEVKNILSKACNDCHSNTTKYPWYNNIQPLAWWINNHVVEGKEEINFDEFLTYDAKRQDKKIEEVEESLEKNFMPLKSYLWIHKEAVLTQQEKDVVIAWAKGVSAQIKSANNLSAEENKTKTEGGEEGEEKD